MIDYAEWLYRPTRIDCYSCRELKAESGNVPDCVACGKVEIMPDNYLSFGLIERYSGIFVDGMGGINSAGIQLALDAEDIPDHMRSEMINKIVSYLQAGLKTQRSKTNG